MASLTFHHLLYTLLHLSWIPITLSHSSPPYTAQFHLNQLTTTTNGTGLTINGIPPSTREYWMRQANLALFTLAGPCPFEAFGTVIVNHTRQSGLGTLVCIGANRISASGNPTLHGEMAAITNCSQILTDPDGPYKLTGEQALAAYADLSLYTNAEGCPMCSSAIRWANFREYFHGTSAETLVEKGWNQIRITSIEVLRASFELPGSTRHLGGVLADETDPLFSWQFDMTYPCPNGCGRTADGKSCAKSDAEL